MSRISPRTLPQALLDRYQTSGPRYTSYPTAPQFQADFDRAEVISRFKQSNRGDAGLSFYLHLPFCKSRCRYCGCYTLLGYEEAGWKQYVDAVLNQADWVLESLDGTRPVEQLAMGGGTLALKRARVRVVAGVPSQCKELELGFETHVTRTSHKC